MKKINKKIIEIKNARSEEQRKVMEKIAESDHCPFCLENLSKYHKNPIIKEGKFWLLTKNQWPYENTNHQFLAIYKTHIEHISEMNPGAGKELVELFQQAAKETKMPGGAVAIRFGSSPDGNYGSSVLHLHAHLIEPDLKNPKQEKIKFKIGEPNNSTNS